MSSTTQKAVTLIGAGALAWLVALLPREEGVMLIGYNDPLGIPTKCMGDTRNVVVGHKYSMAECKESMMQALIDHAAPLLKAAPELRDAPDSVLAATISAAYKSGPYSALTHTLLIDARGHNWPRLCYDILFAPNGHRWYVTGRDRASGKPVLLKGLVKRADFEYGMCITDLHLPDAQKQPIIDAARADLDYIQHTRSEELDKLESIATSPGQ